MIQDNLLFLSPSTHDTEPLLVLEFLHRLADALEEFLGSPLLASKITANYDIVAQIVAEVADGGVPCQGEANALRDVVETGPGVLNNLLGKVGLPSGSTTPGLGSSPAGPGLQRTPFRPPVTETAAGSAIPWRRSNVRHTSNELYVDLVETLSVTLAPSGRPLSAFAYGSIAFTSKVSGVPDLLLTLSTGGKGAGMGNRGDQLRNVMERAVFHPCVRLNRWKQDGVMSFVPPDGRFALCGYEVDLLGLGVETALSKTGVKDLGLPATVEVTTNLGREGSDFEIRISQPSSSGRSSAATASLQSNLGPSSRRAGISTGEAKGPTLEDLTVRIPLPAAVRNISDLRPTKGEAHWSLADGSVEWKIPPRDFGPSGAVLRCTVQGPLSSSGSDEDGASGLGGVMNGMTATTYDYTDDVEPSTSHHHQRQRQHQQHSTTSAASGSAASEQRKAERNKEIMPNSATLSFSTKGALASGLRVESLLVDTKKSRGVGAEVKPYKGVKYLTVSREGVEVRC